MIELKFTGETVQEIMQQRQMVLVQPVDEKCVGYFELDDLGGEEPRHDGLEPGFEGLMASDPRFDGLEDLSPEEADFLGWS